MMAPRYCEFSFCATTMAVGPSAAPMMPMDAASLSGKKMDARHMVKKIPNCAAAPKIISLGLDSSGPKSIIAPIPMNRISGKSSFAMPALYSVDSAPSLSRMPSTKRSTAPEFGRLTKIAPKPIGRRRVGSMSCRIAR